LIVDHEVGHEELAKAYSAGAAWSRSVSERELARLTAERDAAQAAMVDGALREADLLSRAEKAEAECEALRADVVWLLAHKMIGYGDRISYAKEPRSWSLRKELDHDGTPDGILRAVREAREG